MQHVIAFSPTRNPASSLSQEKRKLINHQGHLRNRREIRITNFLRQQNEIRIIFSLGSNEAFGFDFD